MNVSAGQVARQVTTIIAIAVAWYGIYLLNEWLFPFFEYTLRANWIFLPAAFRPLIILMFGGTGAIGLVLGAFLTFYGTSQTGLLHELAFSAVLGMTPWIAVASGRALLDLPQNLSGLKAGHVPLLCALCAGMNAITLNSYLWATTGFEGGSIQIAAVFVGDLVGSTIVLFLMANILAFAMPRRL